jgi:Protein of unknown function (DUF2721).|tara:strand:- start:12 stop:437 length:426 start_codon:yes stop_codon:yes gene_type:complete
MYNFQLTFPAFLFPAIPLMMLTFGNRWIAISSLIRKVHGDFIDVKINKKSKLAKKYLQQIKVLNTRLKYVKLMQFFSGLSFLFNLLTIIIGIFEIEIAVLFFIPAILFFSIAIIFFLIEINLSSKALKTHLQDLQQIDSQK